jgi:hypothetical protein
MFLVLTGGPAAAVDITACGQQVPPRDEASLVADLDCDGGLAILLGERATLSMGGHAVVGQIGCNGSCTITGPGDISGASGISAGIYLNYSAKLGTVRISQVTVHDNGDGIGDGARQLVLTDVVSSNNRYNGIYFIAGSIRGRNVTTSNNGSNGILAGNVSVHVDQLTAIGNAEIGLNHGGRRRILLVGSQLTGNQWSSGSGPLDLFSIARPKLLDTVCEHSLGPDGPGGSAAATEGRRERLLPDGKGEGTSAFGGYFPLA